MARITTHPASAEVECLAQGCLFKVNVPAASRSVMESELKAYYRDHRAHRHPEYEGRTLFDFVLGPDWPLHGNDEE